MSHFQKQARARLRVQAEPGSDAKAPWISTQGMLSDRGAPGATGLGGITAGRGTAVSETVERKIQQGQSQ